MHPRRGRKSPCNTGTPNTLRCSHDERVIRPLNAAFLLSPLAQQLARERESNELTGKSHGRTCGEANEKISARASVLISGGAGRVDARIAGSLVSSVATSSPSPCSLARGSRATGAADEAAREEYTRRRARTTQQMDSGKVRGEQCACRGMIFQLGWGPRGRAVVLVSLGGLFCCCECFWRFWGMLCDLELEFDCYWDCCFDSYKCLLKFNTVFFLYYRNFRCDLR